MRSYKKNIYIVVVGIILLICLVAFSLNHKSESVISQEAFMQKLPQIQSLELENGYLGFELESKHYKILQNMIDKDSIKHLPITTKSHFGMQEVLNYIGLFVIIILGIAVVFSALKALLYQKPKVEKPLRQHTQQFNNTFIQQDYLFSDNAESSIFNTPNNAITFNDVAGINEVKEELFEIIDYLKNTKKYRDLGIKLPKGVLLVGPPGVGKTMIAKAVATEAKVPFFYQSGSSFVQVYVGMGAKRVRDLFLKAKSKSPSIIFIDEIDALGKARGNTRSDEREATLNQLLTEMDGFEDASGVIVIAATNKIDVLDSALLRSGRFDRRIYVELPDVKERAHILEVYLKNKKHDLNLNEIAKLCVGFSGASIAALINEAALNALRRNSKIIQKEDILATKDKVLSGKKKQLSFSEYEKNILAIYQAAKALSAYWLEVEFDKISLISDGFKQIGRAHV